MGIVVILRGVGWVAGVYDTIAPENRFGYPVGGVVTGGSRSRHPVSPLKTAPCFYGANWE